MMLNRITQNARAATGSHFAWLLVRQDETLVSAALDCSGIELSRQFFETISKQYPDRKFPLAIGDNVLADVLIRNVPLVGLPIGKLEKVESAVHLYHALKSININFITIIPLRYDKVLNGILIMGDLDDTFMRSEHGQSLLKVLRRQISLELNHNQSDDVQNQVQGEQAQREQLYHSMVKAIHSGMLVMGKDKTVIQVNDIFVNVTGLNRPKLLGKQLGAIFIPDANNEGHYIRNNNGNLMPVSLQFVPIEMTIDDEYISYLLIVEDMSNVQTHQRALEHQTRRLRTLNLASRAINSPIALQDVIQVVLSSAHEVVNAEAAALLLRDSEDDLIVVATRGVDDMHGRAVAMGMGIVGWVAENAESTLVRDVEQDPRYRPYVDSTPSIQTQSMIAIPLITTSEVIGVLLVINCATGDFGTEDLEILENLGAAAATAIENATLFDQTKRRLTELSTMLDATAMVTSTMDLALIIQHVVGRLREALGVHRAQIYTINGEKLIKLFSTVDASWEPERALAIPITRVPSRAKALKEAAFIDLETSKLTEEEFAELRLRGIRYAVNVAFEFSDGVEGIVTLYDDEAFSVEVVEMVKQTIQQWEQEITMPAEELGLLCHRLLAKTSSDRVIIFVLNATHDRLLMLREMGTSFWAPDAGQAMDLQWLPTAKTVMKTGDISIISRHHSKSDREKQYQALLGVTDTMLAPIVKNGVVTGIVELNTTEQHDFDSSAMSLTHGIANVIGNAIESSELYSSLERRAEALEAAYHELEEADRLKDELIQNMSHELSTPLMHIMGYLTLIEDGLYGDIPEEMKEMLTKAVSKTQHMTNMVKRMVVVHASNSVDLNLKETRIEQLAALSVRTITPRAEEQGIKIVPRISRNLPPVMVDQVALSEVFEALIDNALKFSPNGNQVEVEIRDTDGMMLQVTIHDEGIGIPEEEYERVFRQFYQIDGSTTRTFGGLGLGLSVVRKIIEAHGGRVWIDSKVGEGTRVNFTVPKATATIGKTESLLATS